ncbi:MAG: hypothetical protein IJW42_07285 [Alistipes sp.]|nr:hypothetical protein [Alistipes sp.]
MMQSRRLKSRLFCFVLVAVCKPPPQHQTKLATGGCSASCGECGIAYLK